MKEKRPGAVRIVLFASAVVASLATSKSEWSINSARLDPQPIVIPLTTRVISQRITVEINVAAVDYLRSFGRSPWGWLTFRGRVKEPVVPESNCPAVRMSIIPDGEDASMRGPNLLTSDFPTTVGVNVFDEDDCEAGQACRQSFTVSFELVRTCQPDTEVTIDWSALASFIATVDATQPPDEAGATVFLDEGLE